MRVEGVNVIFIKYLSAKDVPGLQLLLLSELKDLGHIIIYVSLTTNE